MQKKRELFVLGLFFSIGLIAILSWIFFLSPVAGDNKKQLRVWSVDIEGVLPGTQVALAGKRIGKVHEINYLLNSFYPLKKDCSGRYYAYELILKVDSLTQVFEGDVITINSSGLVGDKIINIIPKGKREADKEISGNVLLACSTNIFQEILDVSLHAKSMLAKLTQEIEMCSTSLRMALSTIDDLGRDLKRTDLFTDIAVTNVLLNENLVNFSKFLAKNDETIHQLINDSSNLISDVRHYGLFFRYNKAWKKKEKLLSLEKNAPVSQKNFDND